MTIIPDLFRSDVRAAAAVPKLADHEIYPEELAYIQCAVPKRRAEFATARMLARQVLAEIGCPRSALVPALDRAPVWPNGTVGSISHTDNYCAVVVAHHPQLSSIGLDVEMIRHLDAATANLVLTQREQAWVDEQSRLVRDELITLIFSAKEAFYKCQYPISRCFLEFDDVEVDVQLGEGSFIARVLKPAWPISLTCLSGRFAFEAGKAFCGVELRRS